MSKNTRNRILLTAVAALLLVVVAVGGTLAYLTSSPDTVTNTFTAADIKITLEETGNQEDDSWKAQLIPGVKYAKDPRVTVDTAETTVPIYVYFKVVDGVNTDTLTLVNYDLNLNGWTQLTDEENPANNIAGVYYRAWTPDDDNTNDSWYLLQGDANTDGLKNGYVTIPTTLTDTETAITVDKTLTFYAYAIQQAGFTPYTGWVEVSK